MLWRVLKKNAAVGLTSRHLVIPISEHQDTVGPMTRTVKDAAYILQAIAGVDPRDNYTSAIPGGTIPDYVAACNIAALSGSRIGIPRNAISLLLRNNTGAIIKDFENALEVLRDAGSIIVEDTNFTAAAEYLDSDLGWAGIPSADFPVNLQSYLRSLTYNPNKITSLADTREFTQSFPLEEYPARNTERWDKALQTWNNTDPRFWPAYQRNLYYGGEGGLLGAIERNNLDAVLLPSTFASHWAAGVGTPIVTVPLGFYPATEPVKTNSWGLVETAPNVPYVIQVSKLRVAWLISPIQVWDQLFGRKVH